MARYDILIVGGGVNGCGIARDAAGRGYSVLLAEQADLGGATSSASTKLIHGGLRYLEYLEFRLVREALLEREVLLAAAPHIVRPMRFVLPHHSGLRAAWMLRLGLFLYDHLGVHRRLPPARTLDLRQDSAGAPLREDFAIGFEYSDCWVDDSRLVVLNAMDAAERGAEIRVRSRVIAARRKNGAWEADLQDAETGAVETIEAGTLVNATGPWIGQFHSAALHSQMVSPIRLVQGSHVVVPRLFEHDRAYIFQNSDGRIVFAIPYEHDFTLIGTTDVDFQGDPADVAITQPEITYLCEVVSSYFREHVDAGSVVRSFSGIRPLFDDGASEARAASRDYVLDLEGGEGEALLLNVLGGKITTYRRLAEAALQKLSRHLPERGGPWTAHAPLPGGDFEVSGLKSLTGDLNEAYPFLTQSQCERMARAYGTRARRLLGTASARGDLGAEFGAGLTEAELAYLMDAEWARTAEDVVWRRSKLGLRMSRGEIEAIELWMNERRREGAGRAAQ